MTFVYITVLVAATMHAGEVYETWGVGYSSMFSGLQFRPGAGNMDLSTRSIN